MHVENVLEIANKYLRKVKKTGSENIMAVCPFHRKAGGGEELTPSFTMSLTKGVYFCFSCQEKGNLITFLRNVGVSRTFIEKHYKSIIDAAQTFTPKPFNHTKPSVIHSDPLPESLLGLFDYCPIDLLNEGFDEKLLQEYDVGFDKEHARITFPLRDIQGNLVGLSGRTVVGDFPRYKVYDSEFIKWGFPFRRLEKRTILWNAHKVYPSTYFQHKPRVVLVEGFKACLWLIQHGMIDTMAILGTYLSQEQKWILERIGGEVYLMLDNNEWGQRGTARVGARLASSVTVKVVEYNRDKQQPSDLSPIEIQYAFNGAKDYYLWAMEKRNHGIR